MFMAVVIVGTVVSAAIVLRVILLLTGASIMIALLDIIVQETVTNTRVTLLVCVVPYHQMEDIVQFLLPYHFLPRVLSPQAQLTSH